MNLKSFSSVGHGVSVIPRGGPSPLPHSMPRNLFERAAKCDTLIAAQTMIANALGITDYRLANANLCWADRWRKLPADGRLREMASWMVAECYELMDLVEIERISTLGD